MRARFNYHQQRVSSVLDYRKSSDISVNGVRFQFQGLWFTVEMVANGRGESK